MKLDFESRQVSIAATSGGDERFVYQYAARALRTLRHLVQRGDIIETRISVEAAGAAGEIARAQSTVRTRMRLRGDRRRKKSRDRPRKPSGSVVDDVGSAKQMIEDNFRGNGSSYSVAGRLWSDDALEYTCEAW